MGEENREYKCNLIWTDENFSVSIIFGFSFKKIYGSFATYETINSLCITYFITEIMKTRKKDLIVKTQIQFLCKIMLKLTNT